MQVIRNIVAALAVLAFAFASTANAQTAPAPEKAGATRSFFRAKDVEFFGDKAKTRAEAVRAASNESVWAEPIRSSDGRVSIYVPPKPVLDFLESPTRENAKAYLAWQTERGRKLKAAIAALKEAKEARDGKATEATVPLVPASHVEDAPPANAPGEAITEILYFKRSDCGYCEKQDGVLAAFAKDRRDVRVRIVARDDRLWSDLGITATPSLVVAGPGGRRVLIRGLALAAQLSQAIEEVNRVQK